MTSPLPQFCIHFINVEAGKLGQKYLVRLNNASVMATHFILVKNRGTHGDIELYVQILNPIDPDLWAALVYERSPGLPDWKNIIDLIEDAHVWRVRLGARGITLVNRYELKVGSNVNYRLSKLTRPGLRGPYNPGAWTILRQTVLY